ncbi:MAG: metallophosphoesterase [Nanoarchaeota archaeon]|nr:metallophosphoesterase [Nanoarchaeota archaeon]MBU4086764.1 metallophosphoesterase [Nanoarchaeota archaeon]
MKILAIGDFHGKFPEKLRKIVRKEKPELILSTGDFANVDKIRKIIFKNWAKKWYDAVGLKQASRLEKEGFDSGLGILKKINSLGRKIYLVWGNSDFYREYETSEPPAIMPGFYDDKIKNMKNLNLVDKKRVRVSGVELIGHGGYVDVTEFIKNPVDKDKKNQKRRLRRYLKTAERLDKLIKRFKPEKGFIFLIHYTPYKILDRVRMKSSPMNGKHVGFEPYNDIIKRFKPALVVCGHMHENPGTCRMGKTWVVNPGAAADGRAAVIEFDERMKRVLNVRFVR